MYIYICIYIKLIICVIILFIILFALCQLPQDVFYAFIIVTLNAPSGMATARVINIHVFIILKKQSTTNPTSIHLVVCKYEAVCVFLN